MSFKSKNGAKYQEDQNFNITFQEEMESNAEKGK